MSCGASHTLSSPRLERYANHGAIVSKMTALWIETRECCLDNIYLSTPHRLCGNLKPRGSDSETAARNVGPALQSWTLCSRRRISLSSATTGGDVSTTNPSATWHPQTHIISLYPIFNNEGDSQCLTLSFGAEADGNKEASVPRKKQSSLL